MLKSIIASTLLIASASNVVANDISGTYGKDWNYLSLANYYATKWGTNRSDQYIHNTWAAAHAAHQLGIDGSGVDVLVIDNFATSGHGVDVNNSIRTFAPGANFTHSNNYNPTTGAQQAFDNRAEGYDIVNISLGQVAMFSGTNQHYALEYTTGMDYVNEYTLVANEGFDYTSLDDYMDSYVNAWRTNADSPLFVVAAGNSGLNCSRITTCNMVVLNKLANDEAVINVVALNDTGTNLDMDNGHTNYSYSNRAGIFKELTIAAPVHFGKTGTSHAAPIVSGAAALIMDKFDTNAWQTRHILFQSADDIGTPGVDNIVGHGRLNIGAALSPIGTLW